MQQLDDQILLFVNSLHNGYFDFVMWQISGKWIWIPLYVALAWLVWRRFGVKGLCIVLAAVGVTFAVTDHFSIQVFRGIFTRMRPSNPDNPISPFVHIVGEYRSGRFGFPSAHAANTAGLAVLLSLFLLRRLLGTVLAAWVVIVCYSRMYLGVHYLGDLLAGALFGSIVALAVYYIVQRLPWKLAPVSCPERDFYVPPAVCLMIFAGIFIAGFF